MAVDWEPEAARAAIMRGVMKGVVAGTELVHDVATRKIQDPPKTGRIYTRRGVKHQASAPGQPPATDLGTLVQSGATSYDQAALTGRANWSAQHAAYQEYGTERIEPRPFARPSLEESREAIQEAIAEGVAGELGR